MSTRVYIDGNITGPGEAKISVFDRGFLYGDSVYEVMRTSGGRLVDFDRHLRRLATSAASLALTVPPEDELRLAIRSTLQAADNEESYVRVVVTRGGGEVGLAMSLAVHPTTIVIAKPLTLPEQEMYDHGVRVRLVHVQRTSAKAVDPSVKSGNYLNSILALAEARKSGDYEAIMCDRDGLLAEGSSSNIFLIRGDKLATPNLSVGLLAGITRQRVLELADGLGLATDEGRWAPQALRDADEAFLTSSIRGILPIAAVDGQALPTQAPGPITRRLMGEYQAFLDREAEAT